MFQNYNKYYLVLGISFISLSCGIYSFTGSSIPPGVETFQVDYFERGGQESLIVNWKGPGFDWMEIPKFKLFHTLG